MTRLAPIRHSSRHLSGERPQGPDREPLHTDFGARTSPEALLASDEVPQSFNAPDVNRQDQSATSKPVVMLELRPAFDDFAGIPQEVRLLFRGLRMVPSVTVTGMLQMAHRILSPGTRVNQFTFMTKWLSDAQRLNRYSRVVVSAAERPMTRGFAGFLDFLERRILTTTLMLRTMLGVKVIRLTKFQTRHFEDFLWRTLFAKTLPAGDKDLVATADQMICSVPWNVMHSVGLKTRSWFWRAKYPRMNTRGIDVFIGQTPYPARINARTAMVIRYHDALPVFMPHTIPDKARHQATHFYALQSNVRSGAYFACVSNATRTDLLKLFPQAAERAVTIPNMVSHHYYLDKATTLSQVPGIIRSRLYTCDSAGKLLDIALEFLTIREKESFYARHLSPDGLRYLLIVSTIEPRKNHSRLLAAWEAIKADIDPKLKLVVVGTLGWNCETLCKDFKAWMDRGELFMLNAVPAPDLRVLYRHAAATVCPSLGEGFDFSGVESMASGGRVLASDIEVHREVYDNASEYFDPYSTFSLIKALRKVLYEPDSAWVRAELEGAGQAIAARYQPDRILPLWEAFLGRVVSERRSAISRLIPGIFARTRFLGKSRVGMKPVSGAE